MAALPAKSCTSTLVMRRNNWTRGAVVQTLWVSDLKILAFCWTIMDDDAADDDPLCQRAGFLTPVQRNCCIPFIFVATAMWGWSLDSTTTVVDQPLPPNTKYDQHPQGIAHRQVQFESECCFQTDFVGEVLFHQVDNCNQLTTMQVMGILISCTS